MKIIFGLNLSHPFWFSTAKQFFSKTKIFKNSLFCLEMEMYNVVDILADNSTTVKQANLANITEVAK